MKAAILVERNNPLVIAEVQMPQELSLGQVLVRVCYSSICGSQLNEIEEVKGPDPYRPHLLGHEGAGIVLRVGPGVKSVKAGDHVVLHWRPGQGIQSEPPVYQWNGRRVNAGWVTTFNEYAVVSENRLTVIPKDFDLRLAPLFGCAITTALGVINNDAQVKIGQSVVVFGVGGVGLNIVQAAAMVSAYPIVAVDLFDFKLALAKKFGATYGINSKETTDVQTPIHHYVGEAGADVVIDTTGSSRVIEMAYDLTHPEGKTILVGVPRRGDSVSIYTLPLHYKKILTGSHGGSSQPHLDIPRYIRLYRAQLLHLEGLVTHEFSLDEINEAMDLLRLGAAGRILINMTAAHPPPGKAALVGVHHETFTL